MSKTHSEIRFDAARKKLSDGLKNLEKTVKDKLHQSSIESKMLDVGENSDGSQSRLAEQSSIIQNLNSEINNLQKNLSDLGRETEFLSEQNKILSKKISDSRIEKNILVEAIATDLLRIEEIIKDEEEA